MGQILKLGNYYIYITSKCVLEGIIHIHIDVTMKGTNSLAKLWIHSDGTTTVAVNNGIPNKDLNRIQQYVHKNLSNIIAYWNRYNIPWDFKQ